MNKLKEFNFRELQNNYIYIDSKELLPALSDYFEAPAEATGIFTYCYLEHTKGMCLEMLCTAAFDETSRSIKFYNTNDDASIALPFEAMLDCNSLILPVSILPKDRFSKKVEPLNAETNLSEGVKKGRSITAMDHLRSISNPDAVLVQLVHGDAHIEAHYVLLEDVGEMNLSGILLSEPNFNCGVHQGEALSFYLVRNEKGVMCLAML